jgi:rRNA maturation protein Nop10
MQASAAKAAQCSAYTLNWEKVQQKGTIQWSDIYFIYFI